MEWINAFLGSFQSDSLAALIGGIALGLFSRWALRLLAYAVIVYIAIQCVQAAYAL